MKAIATLPKQTRYRLSVRPRLRTMSAARAIKRLQIKKILVPIDFSPASHEAIKFSLPLQKKFGAELHLVHVTADEVPMASLAAMPIALSETESAAYAHIHLRRSAKKCGTELETANIHVLRGQPFEQICRLAREIDIDLIIIPTRGLSGFKHLLLGSTAERVVRYSPCPVLVLKAHSNGNGKSARGKLHFGKILVPIDFSDCSKKGLNYARAFARHFGAKLVLLNSVAVQYYVTNNEYSRYDFPKLLDYEATVARREMERLIKTTGWNGTKVETSMQVGHAGQHICARADQGDVDLIITSTHGRSGFKHVLVGSTAEYVVQHAAVPVLVVPSHDRLTMNSTESKP